MSTSAQTFAYRARDSRGRLQRGRMDAPSEATVVGRLRTLGLAPVEITPSKANRGLNRDISLKILPTRVKLKDITIMSRQLATMVGAGLSLLRALDILAEQTESAPLKLKLQEVRSQVESGSSFSEALAAHPDVFPPLMTNMVRAGEVGGFLDRALESAAATYEKDVKLRGTIKSALTYPIVVLAMAVLAVIAMMVFIVPVFKKMFEGLGGHLPLPTQILVDISESMVWLGPLLVVLVIAGFLGWRRYHRTELVRRVVDSAKLRLPVFGPLLRKLAIARFARNLASMTASGVPILRALGIVGETSGNWVVEKALSDVQQSVRAGQSIAAPLMGSDVFPSMVVQMIAVGEDSGALEPMLNKIADFYDAEVESTTEQLTSLIEPLMIAVIGVVIGGMIIALYLPIFDIYSLVHS